MACVAFGVFDLFHSGHIYFLKKVVEIARSHNLIVIIIITPDISVQYFKNRDTVNDQYKRYSDILSSNILRDNDYIVLGDRINNTSQVGKYDVLKNIKEEIKMFCFGYDQTKLQQNLAEKHSHIEYSFIDGYKTDEFSTTILLRNIEAMKKLNLH